MQDLSLDRLVGRESRKELHELLLDSLGGNDRLVVHYSTGTDGSLFRPAR